MQLFSNTHHYRGSMRLSEIIHCNTRPRQYQASSFRAYTSCWNVSIRHASITSCYEGTHQSSTSRPSLSSFHPLHYLTIMDNLRMVELRCFLFLLIFFSASSREHGQRVETGNLRQEFHLEEKIKRPSLTPAMTEQEGCQHRTSRSSKW